MGPAIAVILARAGSKGLPGKNSTPVAGRPCVDWTIDHALAARLVGRVLVSTDCPVVRGIALGRGVEVVDRPAALAGDDATVDAAARHAVLAAAADHHGPVVILYANVPVRPAGLIDRAVKVMIQAGCDSVQSYAPVGKHHPWWTAVVDTDSGRVRPWQGEVLNHGVYRRQDLPPAQVPDGGVLVVSREALFLGVGAGEGPHAFLGRDRRGLVTGEGEVVDIDSAIDLAVAEAMLGRLDQS